MGPGCPFLALISLLDLVDPMLCNRLKLLLNILLVVFIFVAFIYRHRPDYI